MQQLEEERVTSASDLTGFLACAHLTQLEVQSINGLIQRPHRYDPLVELLQKKGIEHEADFKASLEVEGLNVVTISEPSDRSLGALKKGADETEQAMRNGAEVIYQAVLFDGKWRGYADFLRKVETPSDLGAYSYEVMDAKLARRPKATAILQLCSYSEQVARIQGTDPAGCHLVLGTKEVQSFRLRDFLAYYRMIRKEFDAAMEEQPATYPDPVEHCQICTWRPVCNKKRRDDDHLSLVAGLGRDQVKKLSVRDVETVEELAACEPTLKVKGISPTTFVKLQDQAAMQIKKRSTGKIAYKILEPPGAGFGLEALPKPSPADIFFDIEADPYAESDGLEFMFGWVDALSGEPIYECRWAHDRSEERAMFADFIDMVMERFKTHPEMHVYHYAPYEVGALRRLMGRHGVQEDELDILLRARVFVDCYQVVRQGLRISEESYSIKRLEPFYMEERDDPVTQDSSALVEYEKYLDSGDESILLGLEEYNRYDCISLFHLQGWLEERRTEAESVFGRPFTRPVIESGEASEQLSKAQEEVRSAVEKLLEGVPDDVESGTEEEQARWLLAQLLNWHRREAKSEWWAHFDRVGKTLEELIDDTDSLSGLEYVGVVSGKGRSLIHELTFPFQEHKIGVGKFADPESGSGVTVVDIDNDTRQVLISMAEDRTDYPRAIVPGRPYDTGPQRRALLRVAERIGSGRLDATGPDKTIQEILLRHPPDIEGTAAGASIRHEGEEALPAACRVGLALKSSHLPIQGPPGAGKTYTGAHMIVEMARSGRTVGITATSHKVISNLLEACCAVARKQGFDLRALQKCPEDDACVDDFVTPASSNSKFDQKFGTGDYQVVAGTAWLMCRSELDKELDTLFIDEAGQFSLANAAAASVAARNLVLLGDPQQLAQPSKGIHPEGAGVSVLEHVLGSNETMPPERGLFLEKTYRMHPEVCRYVSDAFYQGRLESVVDCVGQDIGASDPIEGPGIYLVELPHSGNRISSPEEAEAIATVFKSLEGVTWTDQHGETKPIQSHDLLVVAPYNAQVGLIHRTLPKGARVGTVDKFQGQEGAVTFYSMTTSHPEDIPRNFEFLYSHNRLNVAISRARVASVVLCSPELLKARCKTPEQMRLINALCLLAETAKVVSQVQMKALNKAVRP